MTTAFGPLDQAIVVLYLVGMLGVGVLTASRIRDFRDFFIAGGRLTTPLLVCTLVSTYYGLDVTFGSSETAFYEDRRLRRLLRPFYLFYAARLCWSQAAALSAISLPEVMGDAYGPPARVAAALAASCTARRSSRSPAWADRRDLFESSHGSAACGASIALPTPCSAACRRRHTDAVQF
jgi:hypothetical protein